MKHGIEYISKDDMKKLMLKKDQEIYEMGQNLVCEKERTTFWQRIAFFSWVMMIVMGIICIAKII